MILRSGFPCPLVSWVSIYQRSSSAPIGPQVSISTGTRKSSEPKFKLFILPASHFDIESPVIKNAHIQKLFIHSTNPDQLAKFSLAICCIPLKNFTNSLHKPLYIQPCTHPRRVAQSKPNS